MEEKEYQYRGCTGKGWAPGESGNPNGRPPNIRYLSEIARTLFKEKGRGKFKGMTKDEIIVEALYNEATKGNTKAIEMLHDWTEGKVTDTHRFEGAIPVSIVYKPTDGS